MSWLADVALLRPWWLLAIPLALALWLRRRRMATGLGAWRRAMDPALLAAMAALGRVRPGDGRGLWPPAVVVAILAAALAGPAMRRDGGAEGLRNLDGMAILLDLSPSMTSAGPPTGAVAAARVLMDGAGTRGVGVVVYGGDAYVASPFTVDRDAVSRMLGGMDGETVPDPGSRAARALDLAVAQFGRAGILSGDAVLISDGGGVDEDAMDAARRLRRSGARLWAVYAPSTDDAAPRDPAALARLAEAGGGGFMRAHEAGALAERLGAGFDARLREAGLAALAWRDWGRGLAALALAPLLLMFRRRA